MVETIEMIGSCGHLMTNPIVRIDEPHTAVLRIVDFYSMEVVCLTVKVIPYIGHIEVAVAHIGRGRWVFKDVLVELTILSVIVRGGS